MSGWRGVLILLAIARAASAQVSFTEYTVPLGQSYANRIVAGPDGAMWFTTYGPIGRITTGGAFTFFPLTTNGDPYGIALGPDGALWFTEQGFNKVGRITTGGAFAEYSLATAHTIS